MTQSHTPTPWAPKHKYSEAELNNLHIRDLLNDTKHAYEQAETGPYYPERNITKASLMAYATQCEAEALALAKGDA